MRGETYRPEPTREWIRKSHHLLREYEPLGREARAALGLVSPCTLDELEDTLRRAAAVRFEVGDSLHLRFRRVDGSMGALHFRRGVTLPLPLTKGSERNVAPAYLASEENPLAILHDEARTLVAETGCDEEDAVSFLLTGEPFVLPWLVIQTEEGRFGPRFVIRIGTSDVTAERLAREYTEAANRSVGIHESGRRRRVSSHSVRLIRFFEDHRARGVRDSEAFEEWNRLAEAEPDMTLYASVESFRNQYKRAKRLTEKGTSEGDGDE